MAKLAIIGASYLQKPLVDAAHSLGHETYCFAWKDGAVCADICTRFFDISITDCERIAEECRAIGIDGVCSIASDLAAHTVSYIADALGLVGNPLSISHQCSDKYAMRRCLDEAGVRVPKYSLIKAGDAQHDEFPVIVKPTDRSGSAGVQLCYDQNEVEAAVLKASDLSFSKSVIVEEFVQGAEISVESFSQDGRHRILVFTDKEVTPLPYFVEIGHHQPSKIQLVDGLENRCEQVAIAALNALGIQYGAAHTELLITPSGDIVVVEVGARMGGDFIGSHLVKLSTGFDYVQAVVEQSLGENVDLNSIDVSTKFYVGVYFYTSENYPSPEEWEKVQQCPSFRMGELEENRGSVQASSERSGYWIYQSLVPVDPSETTI